LLLRDRYHSYADSKTAENVASCRQQALDHLVLLVQAVKEAVNTQQKRLSSGLRREIRIVTNSLVRLRLSYARNEHDWAESSFSLTADV